MALHLLDYIQRDYAACVDNGIITNPSEYEEQLGLFQDFKDILNQLKLPGDFKAKKYQLIEMTQALEQSLSQKQPSAEITKQIKALENLLLTIYPDQKAPPPSRQMDLKKAQGLYESHCAGCHGITGNGQGPLRVTIKQGPSPTDFTDPHRSMHASVWGYQQTILRGVKGTAMRGFPEFSHEEQWALAFYVSAFSPPSKTTAPPAKTPIELTLQKLQESLNLYHQGEHFQAKQAAISAYLDGFEWVETSLEAKHHRTLKDAIEKNMMAYRRLLDQRAPTPQVESLYAQLQDQLLEAKKILKSSHILAIDQFLSAFIILLREGLEAILVLASILAVVRKMKNPSIVRVVHLGWVLALIFGGLTWATARYVVDISGASRELTEGVTAWIAAVTLIWVGVWLHGKAQAEQWQRFIRHQIQTALKSPGRKAIWGLGFLVFVSIYRELFETILFYQTLWLESETHQPLFWGMGTGLLCLLGLMWAIFKVSAKLPLHLFFKASSLLISLLAIVFIGKGAAALQEADLISQTLANDLPSIPLLGLYPNWETFILQCVGIAVLAWGFHSSKKHQKTNPLQ